MFRLRVEPSSGTAPSGTNQSRGAGRPEGQI